MLKKKKKKGPLCFWDSVGMRGASEKKEGNLSWTLSGVEERKRECVDKRVRERHRWTSDGRGTEAGGAERV